MADFPFKPRVVGWELTLKCNMQCIHCGSRAGKPRPDELTEAEGLDLIDQLVELGTEVVTLSGGEPLLHPSWPVYARKLVDAGVRTYMITNGLLLTESIPALVEAGVSRIGISLDGTEKVHDFIRKREGSFRTALAAAERAREAGIAVGGVTHVSRANFDDLSAMHSLFTEAGLAFWQIQIVFSQGRMRDNDEYAIAPSLMVDIARFLHEKQQEGGSLKVVAGDNMGYYCDPPVREKAWKGCFAGRHILGIDADGAVKGCLSLPRDFVEGKIREESLRAIWEDPSRFAYNRYFKPDDLEGGCKGCSHAIPCRAGCTVTAVSATGNKFDNPYCVHRVLCELEKE